MSSSNEHKWSEQDELVVQLCDENLGLESCARLNELLLDDFEAQRRYVRSMDLQAMIRMYAQSLDNEDFAVLEAQAALDAMVVGELPETASTRSLPGSATQLGESTRRARPARGLVWIAAAVVLCTALASVWWIGSERPTAASLERAAREVGATNKRLRIVAAQLRGTVGARWAGDRLELPEGEKFLPGRRLELVEGLAEIYFNSGARVILQGPAIVEVHDLGRAVVSLGRVAVSVPADAEDFCVETNVALLAGDVAEYGVEIEVDGSLATEVYDGELEMRLGGAKRDASTLKLAKSQAVKIDAQTGHVALMPERTHLRFVRYLPRRDTRINLADVVAGGVGRAFQHGISLVDGQIAEDYGPPAQGNGKYIVTHSVEFVDGVFIPNGKLGAVQVDSIGRSFAHFPATSGDCWGGAIMARRPRYESSLPLIRLEFFGEDYGYVNWLHIAGDAAELTPAGLGLIGMHSNCGITFDLHAMRARYPGCQIARFRALVGNLESKPELPGDRHTAEAWVLVDGELRHHREGFCRESGPQAIDVPLSDRDRFLVLAVTDDGGSTAYDWVAFGDAVIEMNERDSISYDDEQQRQDGEVHLARLQ